MTAKNFLKILDILRSEALKWKAPVVSFMAVSKGSPYKILFSTILSLRTKDEITELASKRLFAVAKNTQELVKLSPAELEKIIYPVGFYRVKSKNMLLIAKTINEKYGGKIPQTLEELLSFKGVGRKTANLVLALGFNKSAICVDIHVHRISNRFGFVKTKTPEKTEFALMKKLPKKYWIKINDLLVAFGQTICRPISPKCSICPVHNFCPKIGIEKYR